ncbi:MAG TPA: hemerythrin domain-containing protein [Burkholderiales bacterium]|nr:hemerythrin domain-containing protein [Burkholderiales bacterium]
MAAAQQSIAFEFLQREHEEIDRLLGQLIAGQSDARAVRRQLQRTLEQHMVVEEKVFYPALARVEMLNAWVDHLRDQHRLIRASLQALQEVDPDREGFAAALRRLCDLVERHVEEEENRAFDYAAQHLGKELEGLAVEMEHEKEAAQGASGVG